jgi:hypothetical protein
LCYAFSSPLRAFAPSHLREASSKEDCVEYFSSVSLFLCSSVLRFLPFIFVASVSRWFNFCIFSASVPYSRHANGNLAGGDTLPHSRRFWQMQRHAPCFSPSKIRHAAPASRVPAIHIGGNFAIFAFTQKQKSSLQSL